MNITYMESNVHAIRILHGKNVFLLEDILF